VTSSKAGQGVTMHLKLPWSKGDLAEPRRRPEVPESAKHSSLVDPTAVVDERRLFVAEPEVAGDGLGSAA
jgi:hypothetical protein